MYEEYVPMGEGFQTTTLPTSAGAERLDEYYVHLTYESIHTAGEVTTNGSEVEGGDGKHEALQRTVLDAAIHTLVYIGGHVDG